MPANLLCLLLHSPNHSNPAQFLFFAALATRSWIFHNYASGIAFEPAYGTARGATVDFDSLNRGGQGREEEGAQAGRGGGARGEEAQAGRGRSGGGGVEGWGGANRSSSGWVDLGDSAFDHGEGPAEGAAGGGGSGGGAAQGARGARGRFLGAPGRRYAGVRGGGWSVGSVGSVGGQPWEHMSSLPYGFPPGGTQSSGNGPAPRGRHEVRQPGENGGVNGGSGGNGSGNGGGGGNDGSGGNDGIANGGGVNRGLPPASAAGLGLASPPSPHGGSPVPGMEDRGVAWRRARRTLVPGSRWEAVQGALRDGRLLALPFDRRYSSVSATFSRLFPDTFDR